MVSSIEYRVLREENRRKVAGCKLQVSKTINTYGALLAALTGSLKDRVTGQLIYLASYNLLPNQLTS